MNLFRYLYSLLYMHTIYISITLISELHDFFYKVQFKKIKKLPKVGVGENSRIQRTIGGIIYVLLCHLKRLKSQKIMKKIYNIKLMT